MFGTTTKWTTGADDARVAARCPGIDAQHFKKGYYAHPGMAARNKRHTTKFCTISVDFICWVLGATFKCTMGANNALMAARCPGINAHPLQER